MKTAEASSVDNSNELLIMSLPGNERSRTPQVLFQPFCVGKETSGIHDCTFQTIMKCDINIRFLRQLVLSGSTMSNNLIDNKPTEIVNNDDEDDKNDDDDDGDEDDDARIDNEAKNVNDDNSDGATIRRRRIRKQGGAGGPASNATHHGKQAVYSQVGS